MHNGPNNKHTNQINDRTALYKKNLSHEQQQEQQQNQ